MPGKVKKTIRKMKEEDVMSKGKIIAIVVVALAMMVVIGSQMSKSDDMQGSSLNVAKIDKVCELSPEGAGGITYKQAYENFFGSPDWKYFLSDNNVDVVEFSGDCTYLDKSGMIYIQFQLDDNGEIKSYYAHFKEEGQEEKTALESEAIEEVIFKPFVEYAENVKKEPLTEEEQETLYGNFYEKE